MYRRHWKQMQTTPNKTLNSDTFFARSAHYKCAGYGRRYKKISLICKR